MSTVQSRRTRRFEAASLAAVLFMVSIASWSEPAIASVASSPQQDYSRFRHDTAQHRRMPCLVCHVRNDERNRPAMPGHIPCASCHQEQFADNRQPMCTICHTATDVKPFPGLRSFTTVFDHGRHLRQTGCATCHKPASRGVALSIPMRTAAHTTCFQCHSTGPAAPGKLAGSCSTCHTAGRPARFTASSTAYKMNFSHGDHTRRGVSCSECHSIRAGRARRGQVSSPMVSMHFAPARTKSCAACHDNKRAFGGTDFADCKRCHEGATFRF